jgi:1-acyl-sn-glycerol-3-phosphate acyltransferase
MPSEPSPLSGHHDGRGVKSLAKSLLALFFRRVEVTGLAALPAESGGLLLAWHPNGLIDPALVLATFPGRVVFGARHGLFRWPLLGGLLRRGAVPIFRRQDLAPAGSAGDSGDVARLQRGNDTSLAALAEAIAGGSFAMLFPEGDSHDRPHPLELKTGAARLYLDALAHSAGADPAPRVVPVGLHYDHKRFFRSRALVVFHPPLELPTGLAAPESADADGDARRRAARLLTDRFAEALDRAVLATDDWRDHHLMHRLRRLLRAERAARAGADPGPTDMRERLLGFERIWTAFRELGENRSAGVVELRRRVGAYDRLLRRLGLEDHELDRDPEAPHGRMLAAVVLQRFVLDGLLGPLALLGVLANLPTALLLALVARFAARQKKDVASIKLLCGAVLFPATWTALGVLAASLQPALAAIAPATPDRGWVTGLFVVALAALGGALVLVYGRLSRRWGRALAVRVRRRLFARWVNRLRAERASIFDDAIALARDLELPGRVGPGGEILADEARG